MLRLHEYTYHRPAALADAVGLLREHPDALPIAGGTDLMPNMKHRLFTPRHLVALKGIGELHGIGSGGCPYPKGRSKSLKARSSDGMLQV